MSSNAPRKSDLNLINKRTRPIDKSCSSSASTETKAKRVDKPPVQVCFSQDDFQLYAQAHNFIFEPQEGDCKSLFFAPVALLGGELGAYAKESIEPDVRLGVYHGNRVKFAKATLHETESERDYFFVTREDDDYIYGIDGKSRRNFAAMINGTSEFLANVEAVPEGDKIIFQSTETIHPGDQLLICYGDNYTLDEGEALLLNPKDNWRNSSRLIKKFDAYYQFLGAFPPELVTFLEFPAGHYGLVGPKENLMRDRVTVDLPLVVYKQNVEAPLSLMKSENLSPLMYYCWLGEVDKVNQCLAQGASPNRQSAKRGITALHLVLSSPRLSVEIRVELIKNLFSAGANFKIQSAKGHCPLSFLVNNEEPFLSVIEKFSLVRALMEANIISNKHSELLNKLYGLIRCSSILNLEQKKGLIELLKESLAPQFVNENMENLFIKMIEYGNCAELVCAGPLIEKSEIDELEEGGLYDGAFERAIEALVASERIEEETKKSIFIWLYNLFEEHQSSEDLTGTLDDLWDSNFDDSEEESNDDSSHKENFSLSTRALIELRAKEHENTKTFLAPEIVPTNRLSKT